LFLRYIHDKLQSIQPREVVMGLHRTAHYLQSKGRGNDTMLVHMTPGEVKGLQALALRHGGSLTINPDTGLPEAGFLEQILPVVAAAGLTYLTAGAAAPTLATALGSQMAGGIAAGALSGAAISGGMAAIQGKDAGQAALMGGLGGGIAGGLGAYDAANVFNAPNLLSDTAQKMATSTPEVATEIAKQAAGPTSFTYSPSGELIPSGTGAAPVGVGATPTTMANVPPTVPGAPIPGSTIPGLNTGDVEAQLGGFYGGSAPINPYASASDAQIQAAIKAQQPATTFYQDQGTLGRMAIQGLPAIGLLEDKQQTGPQDTYVSPLRRLSPNFQAYEPPRPNPYYSATYPRYAAKGGIMQSYQAGGPVERMSMMNTAMNPQGGLYPQGMIDKTQYATPIQRPVSAELVMETPAYERSNPMLMNTGGVTRLPKGDAGVYKDTDPATRNQDAFTAALTRLGGMQKKANVKGLPALKAVAKPLGDVQELASGGLGGYSDGGRMLKGPGDGMSDSIPGVIGGKQPARLADGEFVVPADVVSHLGNGSTDAGARKLYTMMDKIRKARTGKKKQAPAVKADRYMPA
jgi:hypothetical protein